MGKLTAQKTHCFRISLGHARGYYKVKYENISELAFARNISVGQQMRNVSSSLILCLSPSRCVAVQIDKSLVNGGLPRYQAAA